MVRNRLNKALRSRGSRGIESDKGSEDEIENETATAGVATFALAISAPLAVSSSGAVAADQDQIKHVLLISVDGMHQSDLDWYVANHPNSELAGGRRRR